MPRLAIFLLGLSTLALLIGFAGHVHPMFDAIAAGRRVATFGMLIFLTISLLIARRNIFASFSFLILVLASLIALIRPEGESGNVRVYSKNLFFENTNFADVAADIQATQPDLVILQEVSHTNEAILVQLQDQFPYQARCPWQGWNGIAVLSQWPLSSSGPSCSPERSLMAIMVERPNAPFWAIGVHLQQPWPDVQWLHLERALPVLAELEHGVIVAGDFNTMPWTSAAKKIGEITGTRNIPINRSTFYLWGFGLPLDQVWALGGRGHIRPAFGSDHMGIVADVWPSQLDH